MQKNQPTGMTEKDMIGLDDEIGQEINANMRQQLEAEKKLWEENLKKAEESVSNYEEQWLVEKRLWQLKLEGDNIRPITPTSRVEEIDEWWVLQKKMAEFKFRETAYLGDKKLAELQNFRDECARNLKEVVESLDKLDA